MDLTNKFKELTAQIDRWAEAGALPAELASETLAEAARYSLGSGGKRVRPVMCLLVAEMLEVETALLEPFVLALELVHTSSLIHDDLPGLDNDEFRRGKPTCHRVYGEGAAIIAGDMLIARAFQ